MNKFYATVVKRFIDFVISLISIIILSPIFVVIGFLVKIKLGSPVLFCQVRPGYHEKLFKMYKFRTMTDERDANGNLLPDNVRLNQFGKMLRATSLDELPELINILKGDMSLIGPRPQLVRDMVFMSDRQRKRHSVRPGLSGLAQISGRNRISWEEKLDYDLEYLENVSFIYDVKIFLKTIGKVIKKDGVNTEGMDTAEDFGDYLLNSKKIDKVTYDMMQDKAESLLR